MSDRHVKLMNEQREDAAELMLMEAKVAASAVSVKRLAVSVNVDPIGSVVAVNWIW